jgi:hypothetical protein
VLGRVGRAGRSLANRAVPGELLRGHRHGLATTAAAVAETSWLLLDRLGSAFLVAVAERLGSATIATMNHRDSAVIRPRHLSASELLP